MFKNRLLLVSQFSSRAPYQALLCLLSKCNPVLISIPVVYFFSFWNWYKWNSLVNFLCVWLLSCNIIHVRFKQAILYNVLSHCSYVWLFVTLWTIAYQAPRSMGILQTRILEWVAMPSSRGSSRPRNWNCVSYISCIVSWVPYD